MKTFKTTLFIFLCATYVMSCKKDVTKSGSIADKETAPENIKTSQQLASDIIQGSLIEGTESWIGAYSPYNATGENVIIKDFRFIDSGYARIYSPTNRQIQDPYNYYFTSISLRIPVTRQINGDNIRIEAGVKNGLNSSVFIPYHGRDVSITIVGTTNKASVLNIIPVSYNAPDYAVYGQMAVGKDIHSSLPELQYLFDDWGTLSLQTKDRTLSAFRNGTALPSFSFGTQADIGTLKGISFGFKGSGYLDWVKMYDATTNNLIMEESFNTDSTSTIIWY